ncbi:efflux transporter outer membrane subunit [Cupriavidus agavae]|uniref:NodT family efflux transporter outer membrane factor (OMF) lipoprotein n=1 Tax=Cupriavidus agavae TaxID=1001822 RepID=A0A4V2FH80_9BURK|nr:efflux transporter outer membrane subunit [Cupriavidus agavae]RZT39349.1 NodT family efflux transporter outer membrane factor (OMF) lipoprotein [Cupriavidus agavae]
MFLRKPAALTALLLALGGCATQPTEPAPLPVALPDAWRFAAAGGRDALSAAWWQSIGSAELDGFVGQALADNPGLAAAEARLRQARAGVVIAAAPLWPELNAEAGAQRNYYRADTVGTTANSFRLGLAASYEVDLWGGVRAGRTAALDTWRASGFDRDATHLALTSEVALAWLQTASLRERVQIARRLTENARRVLGVVEARRAAGQATLLELAQQRGFVARQARAEALLRQRANDSLVALATLLGQPVANIGMQTASLDGLQVPLVSAGLPAALMARRPDLAAAEARLAAARADIAVARALMLPRLTLNASVSGSAERPRLMFDQPAYALAAGLLAPVFNAGRLAAGRDQAEARREELLADYRAAIVAATADVELALNTIDGVAAQRVKQDEELREAQRAFVLAEHRYRAGAETLLTMLDAQRTLHDAEDAQATLRLSALQAVVLLYKALGGGWQRPAGDAAA